MSDTSIPPSRVFHEASPKAPNRAKQPSKLPSDNRRRIHASLSAAAPVGKFSESMMLTLQQLAGNDAVVQLVNEGHNPSAKHLMASHPRIKGATPLPVSI